ncbi:MAG TPA: hypothetical protein VK665_01315 [Candidatus Elarobacter sp.]|nr:hypothetical protein [Candidatus Elarobacter sp.]
MDPAATFVAPPNNATGIPATVGSVTFSVSISQLHRGIFSLALMGVDAPGPTVAVVPYQTDSSGTATVAIPTLSPHGTYVGTVATNGSGCGGATGNLGRFTVQ